MSGREGGIKHCAICGRTLFHGALLPPIKARLFDLIKQAGDIGISSEALTNQLQGEFGGRRRRNTIKAHVWQINEILAGTEYQIIRMDMQWHLVRHRPSDAQER